MKLVSLDTGNFKLDGGAMFGVVPKTIWNRMIQADENNLCNWAMRCLLVDIGDKRILIDTGLGNKQDEKFFSLYHLNGEGTLKGSLLKNGYLPDQITDVILTHFHFDHVGGAVDKLENGKLVPAFPNATYWTTKTHYDWAYNPNARERASFLKENFVPLMEEGVLKFIPEESGYSFHEKISIRFSNGHTESMIIPEIHLSESTSLFYGADLMPSRHHVGLPYIMGYDIRPLVTLQEKIDFLGEVGTKGHSIFLEHDFDVECIQIALDEKGRPSVKSTHTLSEAISLA